MRKLMFVLLIIALAISTTGAASPKKKPTATPISSATPYPTYTPYPTPQPPGLQGYEIVVHAEHFEANVRKTLEVHCPVGKVPLGGGASAPTNPENDELRIYESYPNDGWIFFVKWDSGIPSTLHFYVTCAEVAH